MTDLAGTGESFNAGKDPLLTARFALWMAGCYAGRQDPHLPLISPHYGELAGLPPLLIHVGQDEILLSDAVRLRDSACSAGVDARLVVWPEMWHVWHVYVPFLPEAKQAVDAIGAFMRESRAPS
jgi:acetyl esterase/lipase